MTHIGRDISGNNHINTNINKESGILKKNVSTNTNHLNEENGRRSCNGKTDEFQLPTKEDVIRTNNKVSFILLRDYPIMSWFVDSGASEHMVNSEEYFDEIRELEKPTRVVVAKSGVELQANRVGTVRGHSIVNGQRVEYIFKDVLFVPDLQANLFSVMKVVSLKLKVIFDNSICKIVKRDKEVAIAVRGDKLYELKVLLHSSYCTPSVTLTRPKKLTTGKESMRTRKQTVAPGRSILKPIASVKTSMYNIEVRPKQKVRIQEL